MAASSAADSPVNAGHCGSPVSAGHRDSALWRARVAWRELEPARRQVRADAVACVFGTGVLVVLLVAGAVTFATLESSQEQQVKCGVRRQQRKFLDDLWAKSDQMDRKSWKVLAAKHLGDYEQTLAKAFSDGLNSYSGQKMWSYGNSMVYAWTIITTLGYGHLSPATTTGRAVSMVYAIIGIPIFLTVLADYGKLFTRALKLFLATMYRMYNSRSCTRVRRTAPAENALAATRAAFGGGADVRDRGAVTSSPEDDVEPVVVVDDEFNLPISLALSILLAYLFLGASMFAITEHWSYFDSFYFVFISMTTIGFGDFVPSSAGVMMCTTLYMIFGLALTSMCINVIQEKLTQHLRQASMKLGTRLGVEVPATAASSPVMVEIAPVHAKSG